MAPEGHVKGMAPEGHVKCMAPEGHVKNLTPEEGHTKGICHQLGLPKVYMTRENKTVSKGHDK